jgi:hypothetical protein
VEIADLPQAKNLDEHAFKAVLKKFYDNMANADFKNSSDQRNLVYKLKDELVSVSPTSLTQFSEQYQIFYEYYRDQFITIKPYIPTNDGSNKKNFNNNNNNNNNNAAKSH